MTTNISGSTTAIFLITLSAALENTVSVDWATADGTGKAGVDYEATSGIVTFEPGETSQQVQVVVYGRAEGDTSEDRTFSIVLTPPENAILNQELTDVTITVTDDAGLTILSLVVATGPRGIKGEPGLSSYQLAVLQGYTGTLAEYIEQETAAGNSAQRAENAAEHVDQTIEAATESATAKANNDANRAEAANLSAQNALQGAEAIADNEYTFATVEEGDAATEDNKVFRIYMGVGDNKSFIYYKKINGVPQPIAATIGAAAVEKILPLISESSEDLLDAVSSNGIRALILKNNGSLLLPGETSISKDGFAFSKNSVDNNAPAGWKFVVYFSNGLVLCGIKDDGTKVGFNDGTGGGGGQSGGITPGDTAVGYDDIRNYTGTATVRDVVGERIGGRFVVDPDSTDPDDGGGVLVGTDGRRWVRQCDFVSYDMFGAARIPEDVFQNYATLSSQGSETSAQALLADQLAADQAIANCHAFANKHAIPVVQNVGRFLWVSEEIEVRTPAYLTGATIVTCNRSGTNEIRWGTVDGVDDGAPQPMYMYRIKGKERIDFTAAELNLLNTTYAGYLKRGSMTLPVPKLAQYRGGLFGYISSAVELYRSGVTTNARYQVHVRDFTRIGRNGAISDVLVKDCQAGTVTEAWIQPKENSWLNIYPPTFFVAGNGRKFVNIQVERSQVNITDLVMEDWATGNVESRVAIGAYGITDLHCKNATADCIPSEAGGAYAICFRNSIDIHVSAYHGLYGWGFQGHHGLKRVFIDNSVMNRFDFHSFGYDIFITRTKFKGRQVYIQGGGQYSFRDVETDVTPYSNLQSGTLEYRMDYFINMREDYAGDCDCNLLIDGLVVRFDSNITAAWAAGTLSFDVVRMNSGQAANYGVTTKTPHTISGKDITFDLQGAGSSLPDNFAFTFCRPYRTLYHTSQHTYLPDMVRVQGMTAINVPEGKNAIMAVFRCGSDMSQNPWGSRIKLRPNGTNAEIVGEDVISVINNPVIAQAACPTIYMPGAASSWDTAAQGTTYRASEYAYRPKVTLRNCYPSIINATGVKAEFDIHGGLLARYSVGDTGNRCRVTGADIQLIPDSAGALYFDAANVRATGCDWFDPMNNATYSGILKGIGNENRGTPEHSPNI